MSNLVQHPDHYNVEGKKECWEEMRELFGDEAVIIFDCLSAYKYRYRAGLKDGNPEEQDLNKIKEYMMHATKLSYQPFISINSIAWKTLVTMDGLITQED